MSSILCTGCKTPIDPALLIGAGKTLCSRCGNQFDGMVFPAFFRERPSGALPQVIGEAGESSCFYHPQHKAVLPCDGCGRFLCSLCEVELHGQHLCPPCIEAGQRKGQLVQIENRRTLYDSIALTSAVLPMIVFFLTILTAPVVIYLVVKHWNSPLGLVRRSRIRFVLALILAICQLLAWAGFGLALLANKNG